MPEQPQFDHKTSRPHTDVDARRLGTCACGRPGPLSEIIVVNERAELEIAAAMAGVAAGRWR